MNDEWDALVSASVDKGRKLRQAAAQQAYNKTLEDARDKLDELNAEMLCQVQHPTSGTFPPGTFSFSSVAEAKIERTSSSA